MRVSDVNNEVLLKKLFVAKSTKEVQTILESLKEEYGDRLKFVPVGGVDSNTGIIEMGIDPGKGLVERLTNAIDAVLELEYYRHGGKPNCSSPREAATSWLGVPSKGLFQLSKQARFNLAQQVLLKIEESDNPSNVNVTIADKGIGIPSEKMSETILSLNRSNKLQKLYLLGVYGQGGSSTFAHCDYTLICSKSSAIEKGETQFTFTIVFYEDLPAEEYKQGRYVYVTVDGELFHSPEISNYEEYATIVKHYGYDLTAYKAKLGPSSMYGLLQRALFDPVLPIMFDDVIHDYRRVIKGARNAFYAPANEELAERGPNLVYSLPMYNISIADYGSIGLEYWVLEEANYDKIKGYVDDKRPILFTFNGQTHAELSGVLIRSNADLPFLRNRLVVHVDCNNLTRLARRELFASTREDIRKNEISKMIQEEIVKSLKSDDELRRINDDARKASIQNKNADSDKLFQKEVAKLLQVHFYNFNSTIGIGGIKTVEIPDNTIMSVPTTPSHTHNITKKIELRDPPTYVKILHQSPLEFYPGKRLYLRIETDANSTYHNTDDLRSSKFNVYVDGNGVKHSGSTPLCDGRMRVILDCDKNAEVGTEGDCTIELHRFGLQTLSDKILYKIVEEPIVNDSKKQVSIPVKKPIPVSGFEDPNWDRNGWPHDANKVATSSVMNEGELVVFYSTVFPPYKQQLDKILKTKPALGSAFVNQYEILVSLHSLLLEINKRDASELEDVEKWEQQERCRSAIMSCISAELYTKNIVVLPEIE